MTYDVAADIRLDPRLKAILASIPVEPAGDVDSRQTLLAEANSEAARQQAELFRSFMELCDTEDAAPSAGLRVHTEKVVSEPDGNSINLQVIRPERDEAVSVAMHDPPPAASTLADVRHPERGLTARRSVDQAHVRFYVDRVGQVTTRAGREVADAGVPLPETAGRPAQTPADGVPALLVPSPSAEDRHVIRVGPQLLAGASVAVDEPLESPATLIAELIPARHLPSPLSARYPSENP